MAIPALRDACVLYPMGLRDTLLNVAEAGFFRVLWSDEILVETSRNIVDDLSDLTAEHLEKTFDAMRRALPVDSMPNHRELFVAEWQEPLPCEGNFDPYGHLLILRKPQVSGNSGATRCHRVTHCFVPFVGRAWD